MSRTEARIHVSCWQDSDFLALDSRAQHAFFLLISQPNISFAGQIALNIRGWASLAHGMGATRFRKTLTDLASKRFVVVDESTGELWVRSFVKYDGVLSGPNLIVAMTRDYGSIRSARIRSALLEQLGEGFREGLPEGVWERLGKAFREGFTERFPLACARHAEPPSPSPSPPPQSSAGKPANTRPGPAAPSKRGRGTNGSNGKSPDPVAQAIVLLAGRRLAVAQAEANAGRRPPVHHPQSWQSAAVDDLEQHAPALAALADAKGITDPAELATAWQADQAPAGVVHPPDVVRCPACGSLTVDCACQ